MSIDQWERKGTPKWDSWLELWRVTQRANWLELWRVTQRANWLELWCVTQRANWLELWCVTQRANWLELWCVTQRANWLELWCVTQQANWLELWCVTQRANWDVHKPTPNQSAQIKTNEYLALSNCHANRWPHWTLQPDLTERFSQPLREVLTDWPKHVMSYHHPPPLGYTHNIFRKDIAVFKLANLTNLSWR